MEQFSIWLGKKDFETLKRKAKELGISPYAYVKKTVLEKLRSA